MGHVSFSFRGGVGAYHWPSQKHMNLKEAGNPLPDPMIAGRCWKPEIPVHLLIYDPWKTEMTAWKNQPYMS